MKRTLLFSGILISVIFSNFSFSQNSTELKSIKTSKSQSATGIKPEDGKAMHFISQEKYDEVVPKRIKELKEMILSGEYSDERIILIREDIWRLENAVISK
ncbi:MAG: hypothetical protein COA33_003295 [Fluviicola sp.]|nr:hypothetical protein [Fluviicola sp.]